MVVRKDCLPMSLPREVDGDLDDGRVTHRKQFKEGERDPESKGLTFFFLNVSTSDFREGPECKRLMFKRVVVVQKVKCLVKE